MSGARLIIASNRLPLTIHSTAQGVHLTPSSGGLATGLRPWHERTGGLWFGWPGDVMDASTSRAEIELTLRANGMAPVYLSQALVDGHYHGFANRVLWPLFHYAVDRMPIDAAGWDAYEAVNAAFAEQIAREYRPGDIVWVHDYHLMLLPALLRARVPHARIGFFLHVPFPSSEVFRLLPWRREVLDGLLGADLIGFHTFGYMRHFLTSLLHIAGIEADVDRVRAGDREVAVGVFPMGIDAAGFAARAAESEVCARVDAIRQEAAGRRIVLGVDRLDYTKGIPRRIEALARLLDREPMLRDSMRYIQVAVPSRGDVDAYRQFRREVDELVGRTNGAYGTMQSLPIHYVHQSVSAHELAALYRAADVMVVTPVRDGMNLVAKEFAASRIDEDGVLVLSEFAGAANELQGALTVNPYDVPAMADAIGRALAMPAAERRARMRTLRGRVIQHDVFAWADRFIRRLEQVRPAAAAPRRPRPEPSLAIAFAEIRRTRPLRLLLDYDGTLVPIARAPELAVPDDEVLLLLDDLSSSRGIAVDIVSGRPREFLERWFGDLGASLWAEHGFWHRRAGGAAWHGASAVNLDWMERITPILDQFTADTPGARLEVKSASLAWHYREAPREFGRRQANELRLVLGTMLRNQPVAVLEGKCVIELRLRGVGKAAIGERIRREDTHTDIVAIGDDKTDDELFRALGPEAMTVAVGGAASSARFRLADVRAVRRLLASLLEPASLDVDRGHGEDRIVMA